MCRAAGGCFDDLFVIIFITSPEKCHPTVQINSHTAFLRYIKAKAPRRDISYSADRRVRLWIRGIQGQPWKQARHSAQRGSTGRYQKQDKTRPFSAAQMPYAKRAFTRCRITVANYESGPAKKKTGEHLDYKIRTIYTRPSGNGR